jgi:hypothetical protein
MRTGNGIIFANPPENFRRGDVEFDLKTASNLFYIYYRKGVEWRR